MSDTPDDPVNSTLAEYDRRAARSALSDCANRIGLRRRELFVRTFADPVAAAVEPWWHGWGAFADALRTGDRDAAVARLRELAGQLRGLHRCWKRWEAARAEWFRAEAEPWNAESARLGGGRFGRGWLDGDDGDFCWQRWLPWEDNGPAALPGHILRSSLFDPPDGLDPDGLFFDLRGVYLNLSVPGRAAELVARVRSPARVADVAPAVGLTIFPAPDLIRRWAEAAPGEPAVADTRRLFHVAPDAACRRLREEFDRLRPGRAGIPAWLTPARAPDEPIEYVREYVADDVRRELDALREALGGIPAIERDLAADHNLVADFDCRVDNDVRLALMLWDEHPSRTARLRGLDDALGRWHRVASPRGTHSRTAAHLIGCGFVGTGELLLAAEALDAQFRSFAAAAARLRGVVGPGLPLTDDALRELWVMVRTPAPGYTPDPAPDADAAATDESPPDPPAEPDGPFGVDGFRFRGKDVRFGRAALQYQLVRVLWDAEGGRPGPARPVEDVMEAVWGEEHDAEDYQLRQLCGEVRDRFVRAECPVTLHNRQGKVQLVPLAE